VKTDYGRKVRKITEPNGFFNLCTEIPDVKTEKVGRNGNGDFVITVTVTTDGTVCGKCGREIRKFYGYGRETELRHLPISGHKTYRTYARVILTSGDLIRNRFQNIFKCDKDDKNIFMTEFR
jgi:hypothetical protein